MEPQDQSHTFGSGWMSMAQSACNGMAAVGSAATRTCQFGMWGMILLVGRGSARSAVLCVSAGREWLPLHVRGMGGCLGRSGWVWGRAAWCWRQGQRQPRVCFRRVGQLHACGVHMQAWLTTQAPNAEPSP